MFKKMLGVKVLPTSNIWIGLTYQQYKTFDVAELKKLVDKGQFPSCEF